ncbi:MAG: hypothetical protein VKM98_05415 [Cyanobacteriota bacterium]|nr:hypothetical protein [Cyanobacteriota bacterium]
MLWHLQQAEALAGQPLPDQGAASTVAVAMARFVSAAPADFVEPLLASPFGRVYRLFLERCCRSSFEQPEAVQLRDALSQQLRAVGFESGEGHALMLALMLFFPPGNMRVDDAAAKLPGWLLELYRQRYEAAGTAVTAQTPQAATPTGTPSFGDRIFLNRMLGLSNLYYIDPEDQEILQELRQVRLQTVQLLLSCNSRELGEHFGADFGDRYWAMAQSGVQKEPLDAQEAAQRDAIQQWLSTTPQSLHSEGGIQRFAAALLFSPPGSVRLANPEQNLPAWFIEGFRRYSSMAAV